MFTKHTMIGLTIPAATSGLLLWRGHEVWSWMTSAGLDEQLGLFLMALALAASYCAANEIEMALARRAKN